MEDSHSKPTAKTLTFFWVVLNSAPIPFWNKLRFEKCLQKVNGSRVTVFSKTNIVLIG